MNHDNDGPQSSEEGSGMHSPVLYGAATAVDGFRAYHPSSLPPPHPPHPHPHSHSSHPSHHAQHPAHGGQHHPNDQGPPTLSPYGPSSMHAHAHAHEYHHLPPPPPPAHAQIVLDRGGGHHLSHYAAASPSSNGHGGGAGGSGSQGPSGSGASNGTSASAGGGGGGQGQGQHYLPPHGQSPPHTLPPPRGHYDPRLPSPTQASGSQQHGMGEWYGRGLGAGGVTQEAYGAPAQRLADPRSSAMGIPGQGQGQGQIGNGVGGNQEAQGAQGGIGGGQGQGGHGGSQEGSQVGERRKEASNVVIACRQCRARKIRCDSTRPGCNNCARRNNQCEYDLVPKRRGPDKRPGTRQRSCKKRPPPDGSSNAASPPSQPASKRKKTSASSAAASVSSPSSQSQQQQSQMQGQQQGGGIGQQGGIVMDTKPSMGQRSPGGGQVQGGGGLYYGGGPGELRLSSNDSFPVKLEHSPTYRYGSAYAKDGYAYGREEYPAHGLEHDSGVEAPRNISLQPMNAMLSDQLTANWARLLKANSVQVIMQEITFVVNGTSHLLSFVNVPNLERILYSDQYTRVHPAFVWAALALANLMRSSNSAGQAYGQQPGRGPQGLNVALALFSEAKSAMEIGWADASYAYAALIVALFESSAQPTYTHARALNALIELDDYIHQMRLTMNDAHHPDVSVYDGVPVIFYPSDRENLDHRRGCPCPTSPSLSSSVTGSGSLSLDPYSGGGGAKIYIPPWETTWTQDQIRAEEVRRLCWSALSLVSAFLAQAATDGRRVPAFGLSDARSWRLLFPGEVIDRNAQSFNYSDGLTAKESVWALYCRSMLLWNYANTRFRNLISRGSLNSPPSLSADLHSRDGLGGPEDEERLSEEVAEVMSEAQTIDESLDMHKCGLDGVLVWTTREYTHNIRMVVTQALRILQGYDRGVRSPSLASPHSSGPIPGLYFKRKHAEDWVSHQEKIVRQVVAVCQNLVGPEAVQVTERPWRVQWVFYQLATCLQLWEYDRTLDEALHLGKKLLQIVDTMNYLWECSENRAEAAQLRNRLTDACRLTGVEPPYSPRQMSLR